METAATRGEATKMAPRLPGRAPGAGAGRWWYMLIAMGIVTGLTSATHNSGGSSVRVAQNPSSRKPAEWSSSYVKYALTAPLRQKTIWSYLTSYYRNFTDYYVAYAKKSHPGQTKITSTSNTELGVCVNIEILDSKENSSYLGIYKCPNTFEPIQNTYCCGNKYAEYCCEPLDSGILSEVAGPLIVGILFFFVLTICIWSCCFKKKSGKEDEEPMDTNAMENQPEEVKVVKSDGPLSTEPQDSEQCPPPQAQDTRPVPFGHHVTMMSLSKVDAWTVYPETNDDQLSVAHSENQTSCTSLGSDGDNGYGSDPLAETKPLDPAYPPATDKDLGGAEGRMQAYQPADSHPSDKQPADKQAARPPSADKAKKGKKEVREVKQDEVAELHLSNQSLYEEPAA